MYNIANWMLTKTEVALKLGGQKKFACFLHRHANTLVMKSTPDEIVLKYTLSNRNVFEETMDKLAMVVRQFKNMSMTNCRYSNEINLIVERVES